jgi:hypothetical protein
MDTFLWQACQQIYAGKAEFSVAIVSIPDNYPIVGNAGFDIGEKDEKRSTVYKRFGFVFDVG